MSAIIASPDRLRTGPQTSSEQPAHLKDTTTANDATAVTPTHQEVPAATTAAAATDPALEREQLQAAATHLNGLMQSLQRQIQFSVDEDNGKTIIKVIDTSTQQVVRQIPQQDAMEMLKNIN